jgi:hypothetical protein
MHASAAIINDTISKHTDPVCKATLDERSLEVIDVAKKSAYFWIINSLEIKEPSKKMSQSLVSRSKTC